MAKEINFRTLGGNLEQAGYVVLPAVVYGRDIVEKGAALISGNNPSFEVAWVAGLIGTSIVGAWVGAKLEGLRNPPAPAA